MSDEGQDGRSQGDPAAKSDEEAAATSRACRVVMSQYGILRSIADFLPAASLSAVARVSPEWAAAAKASAGATARVGAAPAAFSWRGDRIARKNYQRWPLCQSENNVALEEHFQGFLDQLYFQPDLVLAFYSGDFEADTDKAFLVDPARMSALLPKASRCLSGATPGVVGGPSADAPRPFEVENVVGAHRPAASALAFPASPNVTVVPFTMRRPLLSVPDPSDEGLRAVRDALYEKHLKSQLPDASKIKCVIFWTTDWESLSPGEAKARNLLQAILESNDRVAVGGGVVDFAHHSSDTTHTIQEHFRSDEPSSCQTVGVVFAGDGVEAASVVLGSTVKTKAKVKGALSELKKLDVSGRKSCAFMFACCGRGAGLYKGQKNVESEAFCEMFPGTPLIGVFGNGEIGLNHKTTDQGEKSHVKKAKRSIDMDELLHSYSTVFVLLKFK